MTAVAAAAQEAELLPGEVPEAIPAADTGMLELDALVVTASSIATDIRNAPASVSVIGQPTLEQRAIPDISEAIRTAPGVNVGFGSDGTRGISIRGLGSSYTLILVDGKRVNSRATMLRHYNGDLDWVPMEAIERIEIVRGPMSTLYGSDAIGGVVNIITKKGGDTWAGALTAEYLYPDGGTGETERLSGYVGGPLIPGVLSYTGFANISRKHPDDPNDFDFEVARGTRDFDLHNRLTWTPSADHLFDLDLGYGEERYDAFEANDERTIERATGSLRHVGEWGLGTSAVTLFAEETKNRYDIFDGTTLIGDGITSTNYSLDGQFSMPVEFGRPQELTVGGEWRYEELDDPANLGQENTITGDSGAPVADATTVALFVEDRIHISEQFTLTAGLRYDYHDYFGSNWSPKAYVNYHVNDALTLKAGWAQAFKAPNLRQLDPNWVTTSRSRGCGAVGGPCEMVGNPDLQPETSDSFEAGFVYDDGAWVGGLTYFHNEIEDKITSARVATLITDDGLKYVQQINVDEARSRGLEGFLTIPVHHDVTWTNSFTWLFESRNLETDMPLSADPEYSINANVAWQATERLNLNTTLSYYGKQVDYVQEPETLIAQNVSPYFVADVGARYDVNERAAVRLGVNNLFDEQPDSDSNFKENGRTYFVSLTARF